MSKFLRPPDRVINRETVSFTASQYILEELQEKSIYSGDLFPLGDLDGNGEKNVQTMIDHSNHKLRMYGTAKELAENLRIYRNFPESHRYFEFCATDPYNTTPIIYKSLKEEEYVCKPDLFVILQNMTIEVFPEAKDPVLRSMITLFLKSQEEICAKKRLEFVRFDQKVSDDLEEELRKLIEKNKTTTEIEFAYHIEQVFEMLKQFLPFEWRTHPKVFKWFVDLGARGEPHGVINVEVQTALHRNVRIVMKSLQKILKNHPEMFLPAKTFNTVRLFEDGGRRFVMKQEISAALMTSEVFDRVNPEKGGMFYSTVEFENMYKQFEGCGEMDKIEFIRTPILRAKHKAVPIRGPESDFCILSVDAMFQLVKSIIFGVRMFQKTRKTNWKDALFFFQKAELLFRPETDEVHFIKMEEFKNLENVFSQGMQVMQFVPSKEVRNAKKDGFTVQNLKNELKHLGISSLFEEIEGYAELVYEEIDRNKKEKVLRTCDLMDALEMCQTICLMNRVPNLKKFLHFQKSCGKVLTLKCSSCIKTPPKSAAKKFKNTTWTFYGLNDIELPNPTVVDTIVPIAVCSDNLLLYSSLNVYLHILKMSNPNISHKEFDSISKSAKMFILDEKDLEWTRQNYGMLYDQVRRRGTGEKPFLNDVVTFSKHSKKRFYIRTVSATAINPDLNRRVFTEEILEILRILTEEKLEKYEKKWKTEKDQKLTIGLEELKEVLIDLDIDKARITLIPDLSHSMTTFQSMISPGTPSIFIHYEKRETVMDTSQAVFKIFQSIICDIDWTKDPCKKHQNCLQKYKTTVIGELKKYQAMRDGTYVTVEDVENRVKTLKAYCNYSTRKNLTPPPLVKIFDCDFKDSITLSFFLSESKKFGLRYRAPKDSNEKELEEAILPIWKARLLFMMEWIQIFFGDGEEKFKAVIQKAMMFRAPFSCFQNDSDLMDLILCLSPEKQSFVQQILMIDTRTASGSQNHEFMRNFKDRKYVIRGKSHLWNSSVKLLREILKESESRMVSRSEDVKTAESSKLTPVDVKPSVQAPKGATEVVKAPKPIKTTVTPTAVPPKSENCEKCLRTGEMFDETKKELKASENKIKSLEKKLEENAKEMVEIKKSMMEEKKKEMEEKEREIQKLKRNLAEKSHVSSENDALKLKIQQLESKISELKNNISSQEHTHLKIHAAQNKHISQLEFNLEAEKEKLQNSRIPDEEKSRFESEIQEKTRQIHEFHETNIRLKAENEVKERMIQQLMEKLSESKNASSYSTPQVYSNPQKYSTPHNTPTCTICRTEMTDSTIKCHQCRIQFHTNCVSQWLRLHKVCPSCHGQFLAPSKNRNFSTFN